MKTLEQIIEKEKQTRQENGDFGINACKESIKFNLKLDEFYGKKKSLYTYLEEYVEKANNDVFFNNAMVLACWELINNK